MSLEKISNEEKKMRFAVVLLVQESNEKVLGSLVACLLN